MRIAEFAFENSPLLLFHSTPRLQCQSYNPLQIGVWNLNRWIWIQQLRKSANGLTNGFNVTTRQGTTKMDATIQNARKSRHKIVL